MAQLARVAVTMLVAVVGLATPQQFPSPYERGPYNTTYVHIGSLLTVGLEENLDIWLPNDPGTYKVFYFLDGFGGVIPGTAYDQVMEHIASHGMAVVLPWKLTAPLNPEDKVPLFASVMDWAEAHLESKLHHNGVHEDVHLDLDNLAVGGHSAGAHVLVEYLKAGCGKFKAQVLMSPVDGVDAAGLIPIFCITPGQTLNYAIPTLHLAAGLDSVGGFSGYACAPDFLSNTRFYEAQDPTSPRWSINATAFGHGDLLDPYYQESLEVLEFCAYNHEATAEEFETYRRFVAGQLVSFFKAVFGASDECLAHLTYLEDTSLMAVDATEVHENPAAACPVPQCSWWPSPETTIAP
ncbi:chlorophyllase-2-like [Penaeus japonicus]|uniref:chlorophyllase-2-like n=1 Tax=Penaeus japonicus TaxID=27405 RepID=UPI001C70D0F7|nr:chlorophyllase-2-like [Penaeus japonicus]